MSLVRLIIGALMVTGLMLGPAAWQPASTQTPTTMELTLERSVWRLREQLVVTGRLTTPGGPLGGAAVKIGINGHLDESPYATTTVADGTYRLQFWVEDWWGFGGNSITAQYLGDDGHAASDAVTIFQVAPDSVAPSALTIDPVPPLQVAPGERVVLAGTLRNHRNEPVEGLSVFAVVDAGTDNRAFGRVDDQGRWTIDLTVPTLPGEWSEQFPAYRVPVVFEGDWWLAPAQQEIALTLSRVPTGAIPSLKVSEGTQSASPGPSASASASPSAPASPAPVFPATDRRTAAPAWLPVWLPAWVVSPVFLVGSGGVLSLLVGAALLSHARRG